MAKTAGHDVNYLGLSGASSLSSSHTGSNSPPLIGFQAADSMGSFNAIVGVLAALYERTRTMEGQHIDISLTESALALFMPVLSQGLNRKAYSKGFLNGMLVSYDNYETKDQKFVSVGALEPHFWKRICVGTSREVSHQTFCQMIGFFRMSVRLT